VLEASLFTLFTRRLVDLGVPYMASGSVAVSVYGEPRLTHDVDLKCRQGLLARRRRGETPLPL
jgi:hypothetical protein